jgi:photosystem II stability/assembly factor-like uncharacterized protein
VAIGTLPNGRTAGGVFVTPDSGITWNFLGLIDVEITSLGYDDAGRLFAVTSDGIYRHIGADDWELTGPERDTYSYFMKTSTGRLMVSAQDAGIGRSTDSGETWFSDAIRGREVYAVGSTADGSLLAGTFGGGMFKSGNDGETWRPVGTEIRSRVIHELDAVGAAMIASTADGLYRSDDNGESWSDVSAGQPFDAVTSFAIDGAGAWYAGTPAGIYRSTDGAASWTLAGLGGEPVGEIITAPDGSVYALSASTGVYRSAAGGTSWNWLNLSGGDLRTIAVSEAGFVYVGGWGVVWRSTDGGANWSGIGVGFSYVESLIFNGQHHIVAGTTNGAFVSFTGGDFWDFAGLGGGSVTAFAFDRSHALIAGVYGGGVFRTAHVITGVRDEAGLPSEFLLHDNFPNPFNPSTTIRFDLPSAARVNVSVFDALGREVAPLVAAELPAGAHETSWDASDRPSGVYFVRMRYESAGSRSGVPASGDLVRKILLVR